MYSFVNGLEGFFWAIPFSPKTLMETKSALGVDLLLQNEFDCTVRIREIARPITNAHSRPQLKT